MRSLNYTIKISILIDIIKEFLERKSIGSYSNGFLMRENLASLIKSAGFETEEENEVRMYDWQSLIPDIIVHVQDKCIPLELKYGNTSIDEYKEDEQKCERYIKEFGDVDNAFCIFVSRIEHHDYRHDEWIECIGNTKYHYLLIPFSKKKEIRNKV